MRKRWIYPKGGTPFEVTADYMPEPLGPLIFGDLPSYQSPVTGRWIDGRVQRREDLKRTGSRPYEGLDQERKEASRQEQYRDRALDASLEKSASEAFYQLPPEKREILRKGTRS